MHEDVGPLAELGAVDVHWLELQRALKALEPRYVALERRLQELTRKRQSGEEVRARAVRSRRACEQEIARLDTELHRMQEQLMRVSSPQALSAAEREISTAREKRSEQENQALDWLEKEEVATTAIGSIDTQLAEEQVRVGGGRVALEGERDRIRSELDELELQRARLRALLSAAVRTRYERVDAMRPGQAVGLVDRVSCGGCHAQLAPQQLVEVKRMDTMRTCDGCGRILVWIGGGA